MRSQQALSVLQLWRTRMKAAICLRVSFVAAGASLLLAAAAPAHADDPTKILKSMTDYLGNQ